MERVRSREECKEVSKDRKERERRERMKGEEKEGSYL